MQNVDAAPALARGLDHLGQRRLAGDIGRVGHALAARLLDHGDGLLGGAEIVVDREHLGAFLREAQHGGAAVAHALAGRLAGADHDGDLVFETHGEPPVGELGEWWASSEWRIANGE